MLSPGDWPLTKKVSTRLSLNQGCPTLFLESYRPVGFHSKPDKAHLIQQLEILFSW
uniref:Uncharacterized protein n=1 Tax=Anguilla anguilla TaxID=7936 RepID=A0A0E9UTT7_ANGAN